jgi:hypothetical protein
VGQQCPVVNWEKRVFMKRDASINWNVKLIHMHVVTSGAVHINRHVILLARREAGV